MVYLVFHSGRVPRHVNFFDWTKRNECRTNCVFSQFKVNATNIYPERTKCSIYLKTLKFTFNNCLFTNHFKLVSGWIIFNWIEYMGGTQQSGFGSWRQCAADLLQQLTSVPTPCSSASLSELLGTLRMVNMQMQVHIAYCKSVPMFCSSSSLGELLRTLRCKCALNSY